MLSTCSLAGIFNGCGWAGGAESPIRFLPLGTGTGGGGWGAMDAVLFPNGGLRMPFTFPLLKYSHARSIHGKGNPDPIICSKIGMLQELFLPSHSLFLVPNMEFWFQFVWELGLYRCLMSLS